MFFEFEAESAKMSRFLSFDFRRSCGFTVYAPSALPTRVTLSAGAWGLGGPLPSATRTCHDNNTDHLA